MCQGVYPSEESPTWDHDAASKVEMAKDGLEAFLRDVPLRYGALDEAIIRGLRAIVGCTHLAY